METKHTPGPWKVFNLSDAYPGIEAVNGGRRYTIVVYGDADEYCGIRGDSPETRLANAHLIAAAPDLLEALKALVNQHDVYHQPMINEIAVKARTAIAKAEGK